MDSDFFWHSLGGGAIVAAALTFARLLLEYGFRGGERRLEHAERRHGQQRDAEARLERILQERYEQDVSAERVRCATLEHENARLQHAYELLQEQYASLEMKHYGRAPR